jgi:hypothetical protein
MRMQVGAAGPSGSFTASYARRQAQPTAAHEAVTDDARMPPNKDTSPTRAKDGPDMTAPSVPAKPDHGESSASTIVEAPLKRRDPLDAHAFPDGGGSGGAERFRRSRVKSR